MKHFYKIVILMLTLLPATTTAQDFEVDGIFYNIKGNEVEVTYPSDERYSGQIVIPQVVNYNGKTYQVTEIGDRAFSNSEITGIDIPYSVKKIGNEAFAYSTLRSIDIPNSVKELGYSAFELSNLANVIISDSITTIKNRTFFGCGCLEYVKIGNSVNSIGEWAFSLEDFALNKNSSMRGQTITSISHSEKKHYYERPTLNIVLPNSVTHIGDYAFAFQYNLKSIDLGQSATSLGYRVFYGSNIESVVLPNSLTYIPSGMFESSELKSIVIPNSVVEIGSSAFKWCFRLTSVEMPTSVSYIGNEAFEDCSELTNIEIPTSVSYIGYSAFENCCGLTGITLPNSIPIIMDRAFAGTGITSINIPNSVVEIGSGAFDQCADLDRIEIGYSVKRIGDKAFSGCPASNTYCYATTPVVCNDNTFSNYTGTLHVPASSLASYFITPCWSNFHNIIGNQDVPTERILLDIDSLTLIMGKQSRLTATIPSSILPENLIWQSTNSRVATVVDGTITAVGVGNCYIVASFNDMSAVCYVEVIKPTVIITLDQNEASLLPNHILTLTPSASSENISNLVVSSSDPTIAAARIVNNKVQVVGIKEGITTITVDSSDGTAQPATCLVTVYTEVGDVNMDGFVNISDVTRLIDYILESEPTGFNERNADLNGDSKVNISDITALIDIILSNSN